MQCPEKPFDKLDLAIMTKIDSAPVNAGYLGDGFPKSRATRESGASFWRPNVLSRGSLRAENA